MSNNTPEISNPSRVYALFYSFFLIPLMITIFGVLFFFLFKMLTYEKQDPYHLLNNINSGSLTKRWQSAYELSNLMSDFDKIPTDQLFTNQIITMYKKSIHDDPRVRTYLALAMGQTKNSDFCPHLITGLNDEVLENRIASIKSIGMIGCAEAVSELNSILDPSYDNQERLASIISLGLLKDASSINNLIELLDDEEPNIRWDAAISLYKMNDYSGNSILKNLLTREYYSSYPEVDEIEVENAILTVLALISKSSHNEFRDELAELSKNEKNIKIREFAMKILIENY